MKIVVSILLTLTYLSSQTININTNWQLLGATKNVQNLKSRFPSEKINCYWTYDGIWHSDADALSAGQGFWVKGTKETIIDLDENLTSTSPLAITKSIYSAGSTYVPNNGDGTVSGVDYYTGTIKDGQTYYLSDLAQSKDAFNFSVNVPNEDIYGTQASKSVPFVAYIVYPTLSTNSRQNGDFGSVHIPKMQQPNDNTPIFASAEKFPLIIFSHGQGAQPADEQKLRTIQKYAESGYIVMSIFHGDNRFLTNSNEQNAMRPLSVKNAIDAILADTNFKDHIDETRIGAIGESLGGMTTASIVGGKIMNISNYFTTIETVNDTRIKASVGIVPFFGGAQTFGMNFFGSKGIGAKDIFAPYMAISGDADTIASITLTKEALKNITKDKFLINIKGKGHDLGSSSVDTITAWSLKFFDAYLNNNEASKTVLKSTSSLNGSSIDEKIDLNN